MKIGINMSGLDKLSAQIKILGSAAELAVEEVVWDVGNDTQKFAQKGIASKPASGSPRSNNKGNASAAGEYPMTHLGGLIASIGHDQPAKHQSIVGTSLKYGKSLEFGTSRMAARPWLGRSFNQAIEKARGKLKKSFEANR